MGALKTRHGLLYQSLDFDGRCLGWSSKTVDLWARQARNVYIMRQFPGISAELLGCFSHLFFEFVLVSSLYRKKAVFFLSQLLKQLGGGFLVFVPLFDGSAATAQDSRRGPARGRHVRARSPAGR